MMPKILVSFGASICLCSAGRFQEAVLPTVTSDIFPSARRADTNCPRCGHSPEHLPRRSSVPRNIGCYAVALEPFRAVSRDNGARGIRQCAEEPFTGIFIFLLQ
ncbi:hypothetical protein C8Q77DRAFT_770432 [Trametes polyzona]|nr:hypothetical protein C8Q77DRAFT_770432 [Trametes polyzona]